MDMDTSEPAGRHCSTVAPLDRGRSGHFIYTPSAAQPCSAHAQSRPRPRPGDRAIPLYRRATRAISRTPPSLIGARPVAHWCRRQRCTALHSAALRSGVIVLVREN